MAMVLVVVVALTGCGHGGTCLWIRLGVHGY